MRLVDAPNTHNPVLVVLEDMGFKVGMTPSDCEDEMGLWYAKTADNVFEASDPLALLGLVAIWQHRGDNWRRLEDEDVYDRVLEETYGEA